MTASRRVQEILEDASRQLSGGGRGGLPDGVVIAFDLTGDDGGSWSLHSQDDRVDLVPFAAHTSDCRLRCTPDALLAVLEGEDDGRDLFLSGRIHVEGDVGLALRLRRALRLRAGRPQA